MKVHLVRWTSSSSSVSWGRDWK